MTIELSVTLTAHSGHWAVWLLFAVPFLVVAASIRISALRDRRRRSPPGDDRAPCGDQAERGA